MIAAAKYAEADRYSADSRQGLRRALFELFVNEQAKDAPAAVITIGGRGHGNQSFEQRRVDL